MPQESLNLRLVNAPPVSQQENSTAGAERESGNHSQIRIGPTSVDPLLTADEVALRLRVSNDWVWDHSSRKTPRLPVTMATRAQRMGSVKDIQAHLRHAKADTTANEYMQELPESVKKMVGSVYTMLMKGGESQESSKHLPQKAANASEGIAVSV